jgi:glycosyltransferase involved in cell wall biosynthesis
MKTILLISPYWKESHRWMVSSVKLAELWQRMGYRVACVCMGETKGLEGKKSRGLEVNPEHVSETLSIYRVKDFFIPDPLNYGIAPTFLFHVLGALKKEKPDVVIVNKVLFWSSLVTPVLRLMGKRPIVITDALVGITWWPRSFVPKVLMAIGAWTVGWVVLLSAKRVVFFHPQPKALLKRMFIARKSIVIPTGIDISAFGNPNHQAPITKQIPSPKSQVPSPESDITVTYIGRLESVKGVDDFVEAAIPLKKDFPDLEVKVVGWYKSGHPLVEKYSNDVTFTGLRDDIADILNKTDIFVLPSYSEGLSNALMEAMASSCACIATEVGGNRYLVENGVSGFLFPPGDREMLKAHIKRLIEDDTKRQSMGESARKRIESMFDWSVVEQKYAKLFVDVS